MSLNYFYSYRLGSSSSPERISVGTKQMPELIPQETTRQVKMHNYNFLKTRSALPFLIPASGTKNVATVPQPPLIWGMRDGRQMSKNATTLFFFFYWRLVVSIFIKHSPGCRMALIRFQSAKEVDSDCFCQLNGCFSGKTNCWSSLHFKFIEV